MTRHKLAARPGMSLVEVVMALAILSGSLLALARFSGMFAHTATLGRAQATAVYLAADRIESVKMYNSYAGIDGAFIATEASIPGSGNAGFSRQTMVTHVGGSPADTLEDYKIVTVIVSHPLLAAPEKKTTVIAAY